MARPRSVQPSGIGGRAPGQGCGEPNPHSSAGHRDPGCNLPRGTRRSGSSTEPTSPRRRSTVELALRRYKRDPIDRKIPMVGGQHHCAFVASGQQHRAGIRVIHCRSVSLHQLQNLHGGWVLDLHALNQRPQSFKCRPLIPEEVGSLGHRCTCDDKWSGPTQHFSRSPKMVGIQPINRSGERPGIKYYDRR
jgi:hypothetical protein